MPMGVETNNHIGKQFKMTYSKAEHAHILQPKISALRHTFKSASQTLKTMMMA